MTDAELGLVDRVAGRLGNNRSAAIRAAVDALDAATDGRRTRRETLGPKTREALTRLTSEMNRIGVNVNQVARALNTGRADHPDRILHTDASPVLGQEVDTDGTYDRAFARRERRMSELEIMTAEFALLRSELSELTAMINDMRASEDVS